MTNPKSSLNKQPLSHTRTIKKLVPTYQVYDEITIQTGKQELAYYDRSRDEFEIPVIEFERYEKVKQVLTPDLYEILILLLTIPIVYYLGPSLDMSPTNPAGLAFAGILAFMFFCMRWGYMGIGHYRSRVLMIQADLKKTGKPKVDFKFFGFIVSFILISLGYTLS